LWGKPGKWSSKGGIKSEAFGMIAHGFTSRIEPRFN